MRGRGPTSASTRSHSAPLFLVPSAEMGRYEEVKTRRWSEPAPASSVSPGLRKWSGGLMPGGAMGSYCAPPVNLVSPPSVSSGQQRGRGKKVKTYSAYSVSKDCAVHGPGLERQEQERKISVERWRRSSSSSSTSDTASLPSSASPVIDDLPPVNYQSSQLMSGRQSRNSFRRYASFRSNLNEILYEEDEEEDILEEKQSKETRIPFSFRYDSERMDSMGILGLSSIIREKTKHDPAYLEAGIRKQSLNSHQM